MSGGLTDLGFVVGYVLGVIVTGAIGARIIYLELKSDIEEYHNRVADGENTKAVREQIEENLRIYCLVGCLLVLIWPGTLAVLLLGGVLASIDWSVREIFRSITDKLLNTKTKEN